MNADADDLFGAMQHFIEEGHTFVLAPAGGVRDVHAVKLSISGPSGSRSVLGRSIPDAVEKLIVCLVESRLN